MQAQDFTRATPAIDVVIVNWNSGAHLRRCVASLQRVARHCPELARVVVVDNASIDGSCEFDQPPDVRLEIVQNSRNLGFGGACNLGASRCDAPLLLFLNPDVEVEPGTLAGLGQRLVDGSRPEIGIIGVRLVDPTGRLQRSCARTPTPMGMIGQSLAIDRFLPWLVRPHFMTEWDHDDTRIVDQVIGAFMLMRRSDFQRLGGFDERFFVYMEDVDLAVRASELGLKCLYVHDRQARHVGGGTTERIRDVRLAYLMRSQVLYARKRFDGLATVVVTVAILIIQPIVRLLHGLGRWRLADVSATLGAARLCWQRYPFKRPQEQGEMISGRPSLGDRPMDERA